MERREKGRWQAGNQEGRQAADGGGVGVGSRLSLALTVCQSISSRGVEISAIDNRMNINLINNARPPIGWVGFDFAMLTIGDVIKKALSKMESVPFFEEASRDGLGTLGELKKNVYSHHWRVW